LVRIETIRTKNTVTVKNQAGLGLLFYKTADCARIGFHPRAIDDPRGRFFVRAKQKPGNDGGAIQVDAHESRRDVAVSAVTDLA